MENDPYVIVSISLAGENRFLLELVEKGRFKPKSRSERWAARDSNFSGLGEDESVPSFLFGRSLIPITLQVTADEFNRLQLRVGQEVALKVVPVGA